MKFLANLIVSTLAVVITSYVMPGVHVSGIFTALLVAAVLSFLNSIVKPLLVLLTIPFTIFSFGLFLLVINAVIILIASSLVEGFKVSGFWAALFFSLVLSLVTSLLNNLQFKAKSSG